MMEVMYEWIKQIIVLIILGTILNLALPNNQIKKYVHLVFGLLLFIVIVQPIFTIFRIDIVEEVEKMEQTLFSNASSFDAQFLIEKQKKEIEMKQAAYIWNELQLSMIEQANPLLEESFELMITNIQVESDEKQHLAEQEENVTMYVTVTDLNEREASSIPIKEVTIPETNTHKSIITPHIEEKLERVLRQLWGLSESEKLIFILEGGTS